MPDESDLRDLLQSEGATTRSISAAAVIRRSRLRRLPRQVGLGAAATLAVGGIGFAGIQGLTSLRVGSSADTASVQESPEVVAEGGSDNAVSGGASDESNERTTAYALNLCGAPLAAVTPNPSGLVVTATFPDASAGQSSVEGVVTLMNTGTSTITGTASVTPVVTLSSAGIVIWHSNGPSIDMAAIVDLAPGASMQFPAAFVPVVCSAGDDQLEAFPADLPHATPGEYQVSAALDVVVDQDPDALELVTGPPSTITLR